MLTTQSLPGGAPVAPCRLSTESVHRDVRGRVRGQLRADPVGVPGLELKARQLAHQVELRRPDVAMGAAVDARLPTIGEGEVMRDQMLAEHVVGVDAEVAGL